MVSFFDTITADFKLKKGHEKDFINISDEELDKIKDTINCNGDWDRFYRHFRQIYSAGFFDFTAYIASFENKHYIVCTRCRTVVVAFAITPEETTIIRKNRVLLYKFGVFDFIEHDSFMERIYDMIR